MQSYKLIDGLINQTEQIISQVEALKNQDLNSLTWKQNPTSWSILECLEHLNLYGHFYLPQINQKINQSKTQHQVDFKSGMLGNYFAQSMLPKEKLNKMKTFKDKNPINSALDITVIDTFLKQQHMLIDLLNRSKKVNLNKVKIATTLSRFIKLKLGDMFAFLINHNIRHFKQIELIQLAMASQ